MNGTNETSDDEAADPSSPFKLAQSCPHIWPSDVLKSPYIDPEALLVCVLPCLNGVLKSRTLDWHTLLDFHRMFSITWILLVVIMNTQLMGRCQLPPGACASPRRWLIASLANGDIIWATFKIAEPYFPARDIQSGNLINIYISALLPFVYAVSLITLSLELNMRENLESLFETKEWLASILIGAFPWISGLCFILPLTLANFDSKTGCYGQGETMGVDRYRAIFIVGVFIPNFVAIIFSLVKPNNYSSDFYNYVDNDETPKSENLPLIIVSIVTFFMSTPIALYTAIKTSVSVETISSSVDSHILLEFCFSWIHYARSFVTAGIWNMLL